MQLFDFPRISICAFVLMVAGLAMGYLATSAVPNGIDGYGFVFRFGLLGVLGTSFLLASVANMHNERGHETRSILAYGGSALTFFFGMYGILFVDMVDVVGKPEIQRGDLIGIALTFFFAGAFVIITNLRPKQEAASHN